ncbi:MAG: ATP-dependent zinc metalloprotease FtsH [Chloroflexota bacterium]
MNETRRRSLRPLMMVVFATALTSAVWSLYRLGIIQFQVAWPEDQPVAPVVAGGVLIMVFSLAIFLAVGMRPRVPRTVENPAQPATGRGPARPSRLGLIAERPTTRFTDVAGAAEAKEELAEIVDFLKEPERFVAVGARIPRGVLLVGPPGNGKTLLARALAGEANVPFLRASGSDFVEMYVGVGASRIRDLFKTARDHGKSILFIDEIDAVGRKRGGPGGHAHEEREQTLNQLLVEMDGFDARSRVIVVAATNRADILDQALLRPGRFDRQVRLDPPDAAARRDILNLHAIGKPLGGETSLEALVPQTAGLSGADLENLLNEAAILCARDRRTQILQKDLEEGLDRSMAGPRRKGRALSERERRITAVHELGHALVAHQIPDADPVQKVTIVSRGPMGGFTRMTPSEDRNMWSVAQFQAAIASALGGQMAELLVLGQVTTGASNDLRKAYGIARSMVCDYGMSPVLGSLAIGSDDESRFYRQYGEQLAERIDEEIQRLIGEGRAMAQAVISARLDDLRSAADELMELETLDAEGMARLFGPRPSEGPVHAGPQAVDGARVVAIDPARGRSRRSSRGLRPMLAALPFSLSFTWRPGRRKAQRVLAEA